MTRALLCLPFVLGVVSGCESDYVLGLNTPTALATAVPSPSPSQPLPPTFAPTPTPPDPTPEWGSWIGLLRAEPSELQFGPMPVGCQDARHVQVFNDGDVPVTVTNVYLSSSVIGLDLVVSDDLLTLNPGEQGNIWVEARSLGVAEDATSIRVTASEGEDPAARVGIVGRVVDAKIEHTDTFEQVPASEVDVLWIIDNSGSMGNNQLRLADSIDEFMDAFIPLDIQYHMGVVTTDMQDPSQSGRMLGEYGANDQHFVDWTMRETGYEAFANTIKLIGDNGSGFEQGLFAMEAALTDPLASLWNDGFLRDDAYLSIIVVSDEEDQSPGDGSGNELYYVDLLEELKGGLQNVVLSAVVSFMQPQGYVLVSGQTGGLVYPINAEYGSVLAELGVLSTGFQHAFYLTQVPVRGSDFEVYVNGQLVPSGVSTWYYDPTSSSIVFAEGAEPPWGATIEVVYDVALTCADVGLAEASREGATSPSGRRRVSPPLQQ